MEALYLYLILMNAFGLMIMLMDKHRAIAGQSRIPERGIWTVACIGGSLGCLLGMHLFRHKTKKGAFPWLLPLLFFLHACLLLWLLNNEKVV